MNLNTCSSLDWQKQRKKEQEAELKTETGIGQLLQFAFLEYLLVCISKSRPSLGLSTRNHSHLICHDERSLVPIGWTFHTSRCCQSSACSALISMFIYSIYLIWKSSSNYCGYYCWVYTWHWPLFIPFMLQFLQSVFMKGSQTQLHLRLLIENLLSAC